MIYESGRPTQIEVAEPAIHIPRENPRLRMSDTAREAMRLLDMVRAGEDLEPEMVAWCLRQTGDSVGFA